MKKEIITLQAIFQAARTTIDGGIRITFDLDASQAPIMADLIRLQSKCLNIAIQPDDASEQDIL
jgi:hypothetical protein